MVKLQNRKLNKAKTPKKILVYSSCTVFGYRRHENKKRKVQHFTTWWTCSTEIV